MAIGLPVVAFVEEVLFGVVFDGFCLLVYLSVAVVEFVQFDLREDYGVGCIFEAFNN